MFLTLRIVFSSFFSFLIIGQTIVLFYQHYLLHDADLSFFKNLNVTGPSYQGECNGLADCLKIFCNAGERVILQSSQPCTTSLPYSFETHIGFLMGLSNIVMHLITILIMAIIGIMSGCRNSRIVSGRSFNIVIFLYILTKVHLATTFAATVIETLDINHDAFMAQLRDTMIGSESVIFLMYLLEFTMCLCDIYFSVQAAV